MPPSTYLNECYCSPLVDATLYVRTLRAPRHKCKAEKEKRQMTTTARQSGGKEGGRGCASERAPRGWNGSERASKSSAPLFLSPFLHNEQAGRQAAHTTTIHPFRYVECDARLKRTKERDLFRKRISF